MRIDDFQIYKKSLSQSEVIELYQRTSFDTSSPTVTSTSPPDNSSSFSVSDNISVTFSETMDTTRSQPTPLTLPVPEPFRCPRTTSVLVSRCLRLLQLPTQTRRLQSTQLTICPTQLLTKLE